MNATGFGKVFTRNLDGQVYAQPLYVGGVNGKNLVYVATEHNSVYAFDADDLRATAPPVWQKNFGPSVPSADTGCGLLTPEIGITSTPVIDVVAKTIWFTAKTKENGEYIHRLHAVDIATGAERPNSPVEITAKRARQRRGQHRRRRHDRPAAAHESARTAQGRATPSISASRRNCDIGPYHGWVLGYDATTLAQTAVHVDTPNGSEGGIWHGGVGLNADENGDVFYVSGNGTFDGASNFGNSVVRLHPDAAAGAANGLSVASFFTPFDSSDANDGDFDLGSTGGMLIPGTQLFVTGDKRGFGFVVNKNQLGGMVDQDSQIVQRFQGSAARHVRRRGLLQARSRRQLLPLGHGRSPQVVRVRRDAVRAASAGEHDARSSAIPADSSRSPPTARRRAPRSSGRCARSARAPASPRARAQACSRRSTRST